MFANANYCPLIYHSHENNRKINRLHERCLRAIYNDKQSSCKEILEKVGSVSMHERTIQVLAAEIYKINNGLLTALIKDLFPINRNPYTLRQFSRRLINTVHHGTENISNLVSKIWYLLPINLKEICDLDEFKKVIKQWKPEGCPCRLCKVFV